MKISFADKIEALRGCKTQKEFAKELAIPLNTYTNWTRGISTPSVDALAEISIKVGVSSDWLLGLVKSQNETLPTRPRAKPEEETLATIRIQAETIKLQQETIQEQARAIISVSASKRDSPYVQSGGKRAVKHA